MTLARPSVDGQIRLSGAAMSAEQPALRRLLLGALVALALLALGEAAPSAFPVRIAIQTAPSADRLLVSLDGGSFEVPTQIVPGSVERVIFEEPRQPAEREIQVDGTDLLAEHDRNASYLQSLSAGRLYRLDAWLRDESGYSRWVDTRVVDPTGTSRPVADAPLPQSFRLEAGLQRPEARASLWLVGRDRAGTQMREGLEISRSDRAATWVRRAPSGQTETLVKRFFPESPAPFAAMLLNLLGRSAAAAVVLAGIATVLGCALPGLPRAQIGSWTRKAGVAALSALWLGAAVWITVRLYHQMPHILDAVSYVFQSEVFTNGRLWLDVPPVLPDAFKGPFQVIRDGRWFSQYPPGAPAAFALGDILGLAWLVGPLCGLALVLATGSAARDLYDSRRLGWMTLTLGALSPFVLFQAGSFLSHPIAGGLLAGALAAFARGERTGRERCYLLMGILLGAAFLVRETATLLFGLPLVVGWLLLYRGRYRAVALAALGGLPFLVLYLGYNAALTGSPLTLPRSLFSSSDQFGFGDGIGFYSRHTIAAGLTNADQNLTLLQFDLLGWPPLFALGLLLLPFLLRRPNGYDMLFGGSVLLFVAAYVAYFYHGIALGPRYYFEMVPLLLVLAGRGVQTLAHAARRLGASHSAGSLAATAVVGVLTLHSALFYLPRQVERRTDYVGFPDGRPVSVPFVQSTIIGARVADSVPRPALIFSNDFWVYNVILAPLNCARPDLAAGLDGTEHCSRLFAYATTPADEERLRITYGAGRAVLHARLNGSRLDLQP